MPTLDVAINALKAKHGASQFDDAVKRMQRGARGLDKDITRTQKSLGFLGDRFKTAAKAAVGMVAVYGVGRTLKSSIQEMAKFELELANVSTMLDEASMTYLPKYETELSRLAVKYGESTTALSKGLYDILSASIDAADALDVLEIATQAAKAGITDTGTAADILTTIINAYGMSASQASQVSDVLFATVKRGKTTFNELAQSMGMVVAMAATAGLSLEETTAALATMTRAGLQTSIAVTALRGAVATFLTPTQENIKVAKQFGLELNANTLRVIGLTGAMELLSEASAEQVAQIFSNRRALVGVAALLQQTEGFMEDLGHTTEATGKRLEAFEKIADTTSMKLSRLSEAWKGLKRAVGDEAAPAVDNMTVSLTKLGPKIGGLIRFIGEDIPNATMTMTSSIDLAFARLRYVMAKIDLTGILDDEAIKREINEIKVLKSHLSGVLETQRKLNKATSDYEIALAKVKKVVEGTTPHFESWGDARDFLLELKGSTAITADSIMGMVPPSEKFNEVMQRLGEEFIEVNNQIRDFEKTDIEKQVEQFARLEETMSSPTNILRYRNAVKNLEQELVKLGELEKAAELREAEARVTEDARQRITELMREVQLEQELIFLTNDERERAIKLRELESASKVLGVKESERLKRAYIEELETLRDMQEMKELVDSVRSGMGDLIRAPLEALLDETKDIGDLLKDTLRNIGEDILRTMYEQTIVAPLKSMIMGALGGAFGGAGGGLGALFAEKGMVVNRGRVQAFDSGTVVNTPTMFPMANGGVGFMAEKKPEAIMPLDTDASGRLGVRALGDQSTPVINITNILDPSIMDEYMDSGVGERKVVNIMRRNRGMIEESTL